MASCHGKRYGQTRYRRQLSPKSSGGHMHKRKKTWYELNTERGKIKVAGSGPTPPCLPADKTGKLSWEEYHGLQKPK